MVKIPSSSSEETEAQTGATTCPSQCQPLHPRTSLSPPFGPSESESGSPRPWGDSWQEAMMARAGGSHHLVFLFIDSLNFTIRGELIHGCLVVRETSSKTTMTHPPQRKTKSNRTNKPYLKPDLWSCS